MSNPTNVFKTEVLSKKQLTAKIYELNLKIFTPENFKFKAGQCVGFRIADNHKRLFSLTSLPATPAQLSFCVDVSPMGPASKFVIAAHPGQSLEIEGPYGAFVVNDLQRDLFFVATGAGIAPFKSMILDLLQKGFDKKTTLLFGVRDESDIFYFDIFEAWAKQYPNFIFLPSLSQPKREWQGLTGRVTKYLDENAEKYKTNLVYICGSAEMIKETRSTLMQKGFAAKEIKIEIFA